MADDAIAACPHCGSQDGAVSVTIFKGGYTFFWDGTMAADWVEQSLVRETIPRCLQCNKRVPQIRTVERKGD